MFIIKKKKKKQKTKQKNKQTFILEKSKIQN